MKIYTNEKFEEILSQTYLEGFNDAKLLDKRLANYVIKELEDLKNDHWDKQRFDKLINRFKEYVN